MLKYKAGPKLRSANRKLRDSFRFPGTDSTGLMLLLTSKELSASKKK